MVVGFKVYYMLFYVVFLLPAFLLFTFGLAFVMGECLSMVCSSCAVDQLLLAEQFSDVNFRTLAPFLNSLNHKGLLPS